MLTREELEKLLGRMQGAIDYLGVVDLLRKRLLVREGCVVKVKRASGQRKALAENPNNDYMML
ncbi:hypothetical protein H0A36_07320 [Endozoicomonas sp. SM1973]|uniref:Uncharacterized protein n=1 Tax=Spartinivicinus marinus TaxID=2994442 RepID=A0A853HVN3_9GAMM|nr:hypothetical protein [Spartinivicinus marinus]MCX4029272.1 hypothetical protein [Spartinivicinus marinus]NYZ65820.1 hypothetical protein [Spartinivicinus marinus]